MKASPRPTPLTNDEEQAAVEWAEITQLSQSMRGSELAVEESAHKTDTPKVPTMSACPHRNLRLREVSREIVVTTRQNSAFEDSLVTRNATSPDLSDLFATVTSTTLPTAEMLLTLIPPARLLNVLNKKIIPATAAARRSSHPLENVLPVEDGLAFVGVEVGLPVELGADIFLKRSSYCSDVISPLANLSASMSAAEVILPPAL